MFTQVSNLSSSNCRLENLLIMLYKHCFKSDIYITDAHAFLARSSRPDISLTGLIYLQDVQVGQIVEGSIVSVAAFGVLVTASNFTRMLA